MPFGSEIVVTSGAVFVNTLAGRPDATKKAAP
jgi:hypothetical protein